MRLAAIVSSLGAEFTHHIVSLDSDLSASDAFPGAEIEKFEIRKSAGVSPSNVSRFADLIRSRDAGILCTYNFGSIEAALANSWRAKRPHIHHEDGFGADETPERQKMRRVLLRRLALGRSQTVVPSRTLEAVAIQNWRLPRGRVRRIANGIDVRRFAAPDRAHRKGGPVVIGSIGALRAEKNIDRLIKAFAAQERDAQLLIYGDGPERERLGAAAASGRVVLKGATRTPERAYAEFDIFALSSDTEQMPLSLMEAMAAGLPVVTTDVGDVREMLTPENRAFVCSPQDEGGFSAALARLVEDADLRARLGLANAEKARSEFGLAEMVAAHAALYRDMLARAGS